MNQAKGHAQLASPQQSWRGKREGGGDQSNEVGGEVMQGQLYLLGAQFNNDAEWKEQPVLQMHCYLQSPRSGRVLQKV